MASLQLRDGNDSPKPSRTTDPIPLPYSSPAKSVSTPARVPNNEHSTDIGLSATTVTLVEPTPNASTSRKGGTSSRSSTLSTSTTKTSTTTSAVGAERTSTALLPIPVSSTTPQPSPSVIHGHHGLSSGALAAAIVIPILAVFLLLLGVFFALRKRRGNRNSTSTASFGSPIKEKLSSRIHSQTSSKRNSPNVAFPENRTYFTGLDTSSHGSPSQQSGEDTRATMTELPPPPYHVQIPSVALPQPKNPGPIDLSAVLVNEAPGSSVNVLEGFLAPVDRPWTSRSSARSISSTLYSDNASVHSAHAARMSVGAAQIVRPDGQQRADPFVDPNTPVGSLDGSNDTSPAESSDDE